MPAIDNIAVILSVFLRFMASVWAFHFFFTPNVAIIISLLWPLLPRPHFIQVVGDALFWAIRKVVVILAALSRFVLVGACCGFFAVIAVMVVYFIINR